MGISTCTNCKKMDNCGKFSERMAVLRKVTTLGKAARKGLSKEVTFKQDDRLKGSWPQAEQAGLEGASNVPRIKGSMCKGPERVASWGVREKGRATEVEARPRAVGKGQACRDSVGWWKFGFYSMGLRSSWKIPN